MRVVAFLIGRCVVCVQCVRCVCKSARVTADVSSVLYGQTLSPSIRM